MSYLAMLSFDLASATREDYAKAYERAAQLGFQRSLRSNTGNTVHLPTTTCAGVFTGTSAASVAESLTAQVKRAFTSAGLTAEIFVSVGGDWAWQLAAA
jgi:hypothetical protein